MIIKAWNKMPWISMKNWSLLCDILMQENVMGVTNDAYLLSKLIKSIM